MSIRFVIVGGGPGGNTAATVAARLGAEVTLIERDLVGGAAHLWDCIPSKAMIATGGFLSELDRAEVMGVAADGRLDIDALRARIAGIEAKLHHSVCELLESQGVRMIRGTGRLKGPHEVIAETADGVEEIEADAILVATGFAAAHPRVVRGRRRAGPHHPPGLPAERDPRPSRRHRFRRHRRGVRPHVPVARLRRDADRVTPAGPALQGSRGGRRPGGRVPPPTCGSTRAPGHPASRSTVRPCGSCATTAAWPPEPMPCWPSGRSPTATGSASTPPG